MKFVLFIFLLFTFTIQLKAQSFVSSTNKGAAFSISSADPATIFIAATDDWLVNKAATLLQHDIETVIGKAPELTNTSPLKGNVIIIGTIDQSFIIQQFIADKKIDVSAIKGKWEAFQVQTVDNPMPGIAHALVIIGADKRGAAFGVFELSKQLGVSPWYWWADVPAKRSSQLFILKGNYISGSPSVKYRGIFINDEAPAFSGWTREKFGGVNHLVYEKMFELLLRLKANYLWPAMWGNAFNDDDTLNPILADKWGIVMGTSHHEPMQRAQQEWKRYGKGAWDYTKNDTVLRSFWKKGIENMGSHESIVTIGMRGDGDMPMTAGTATELLERVVKDQRQIIQNVTGKPASQTPQLWALYKEVQDYYDKGMRVPDDVTLLLCDDNWGNIRRLPKPGDPKRAGGYGIYYHFDYVGGPRNYKWLNTNNIARVWEQMHMAYAYGVDKIWIVNVGDLKPMELPISFFLDYAYDTKKWNQSNLRNFYTAFAGQQFGKQLATRVGALLNKYAVYSARRKPELLDASTYSVISYNEAYKILEDWTSLRNESEELKKLIPSTHQDAYFQLVLHPIKALTILHELYHAVAMNKFYASMQDGEANSWAEKAKQFYKEDSLLTISYNKELANGKWNHMMDQTHIGYRIWQEPKTNSIPELTYVAKTAVKSLSDTAMMEMPVRHGFYESNGYISMKATSFNQGTNAGNIKWTTIPDIGKDGDGITTFPVTASYFLSVSSPQLQFNITTTSKDSLKLLTYFSPTLNFQNAPNGLQFAVSIDNEKPQVISLNKEDNTGIWNSWVANNNIIKTTRHYISKPGKHVVHYWMMDPGVILQKLVIEFFGVEPSYLGPPETRY